MNNRNKKIIFFSISFFFISLAYFTWFFYAHAKYEKTFKNSTTMVHQTSSPFLHFLYKNKLGTMLRSGLTKKWFSSLSGAYCNRPLSKYHIKPFIKEYNINMSEAEKSVDSFKTFNDFFIRKLKYLKLHYDEYLFYKKFTLLHFCSTIQFTRKGII